MGGAHSLAAPGGGGRSPPRRWGWPRPLGQSRRGRGRSTTRPARASPSTWLGLAQKRLTTTPEPQQLLWGGGECSFPSLCRGPCPKPWVGCIPCCVALSQRTTPQLQKSASKTCYIKTINYNIYNLTSKHVKSPKTSPFPYNLGKSTKS